MEQERKPGYVWLKKTTYDVNNLKNKLRHAYFYIDKQIAKQKIKENKRIKFSTVRYKIDRLYPVRLFFAKAENWKWLIGIIVAVMLAIAGWRLAWVLAHLPKH